MKTLTVLAASLVIVGAVVGAAFVWRPLTVDLSNDTLPPPPPPPPPELGPTCKRSVPSSGAFCFEGTAHQVIDGDTVDVERSSEPRSNYRIRLVLVDAPESWEAGGSAARTYLSDLCLGKRALIDEDDWQVGADPYGRVLAVITCEGTNANAALIASPYASTYAQFCSESEFGGEAWTGCSSPPPPATCDPAYPDVCIPPPPPDLDCADIPDRNFRVLPPDPHRLDGDGDGIGCESGG